MLNIISAEIFTKRVNNEPVRFITIPSGDYEELKGDLESVQHFQSIKELDPGSATEGVLLKCKSRSDGCLGIIYLIKKYEAYSKQLLEKETEEFFGGEDYHNGSENDDDNFDYDEINELIYDETGNITCIPAISAEEFVLAYFNSRERIEGTGKFGLLQGQGEQYKPPFWIDGKFPLVIINLDDNSRYNTQPDIKSLKAASQNRIVIVVTIEDSKNSITKSLLSSLTDNLEQRLLFETEYGICSLDMPGVDYYNQVLAESSNVNGFKIAEGLDKTKVIEALQTYRGQNFDGATDIVQLVAKTTKKKSDNSKVLLMEDFDRVLSRQLPKKEDLAEPKSTMEQEFDKLVGLSDVKDCLSRIASNMKFEKKRRAAGLITQYTNHGLMFLGNPGTCKTTVARIFARGLAEQSILSSGSFTEISRGDIIGKWVGHTSPLVKRIFQEASGGVLFIDEAYSLLSEGQPDGYSEECIAEIILQMENNPDVLVIFAGYTSLMKAFLKTANPGLRSRISHVVEFKDYSPSEMVEIFNYLLIKEQYSLGDTENASLIITQFVEDMNKLGSENLGNGRMMRKLFKAAVAHMAERKDNDLKTILQVDIDKACAEIRASEQLVSSEKRLMIGY